MATEYVLGIDIGSSGCTAAVMNRDSEVVAESAVPYPSHHERPRWVEQDPDDWFDAACQSVRACLARLPAGAGDRFAGVVTTAPHHTAVLLDADGRPVRRAILWNDQRADAESRELLAGAGELIRRTTHNVPAPTWTLPHLLWLARNQPTALERTRFVLFMKDYVRWRLGGDLVTDHIDAGGSLLFDVARRAWSTELLGLARIDPSVMPRIRSPFDRAGEVGAEAAALTGLRVGTPVFVGTADTAAESVGSGAFRPGDSLIKLATAGNVQRIASAPIGIDGILTYEHPIDGLFYLNSGTAAAAASLGWFRTTFGDDNPDTAELAFERIDAEVLATTAGASGAIFLPFLTGERAPYWDPHLRAAFLGLTVAHRRGHLARAVMEGVAFSIRAAASVYETPLVAPVRLIGGGARSLAWRQIIADVMAAEIVVPARPDASFGACLIAAVSAGWFGSLPEAIASAEQQVTTVEPAPARAALYRELYEIYSDAAIAIAGLSHRLGSVTLPIGER